jgi:chromosome segregation ATPase
MADESTSRGASQVSSERPEQSLRDRLDSVQDALEEIESQVQADAESLERLRNALDVSYLEDITRMINELELRVNEAAEEADRARQRADRAEEDLREEQERLEKLWDVYKEQERELEQVTEERDEAQRELDQAEGRVRELEEALESERRALREAEQANGRLRDELADREAELEELSSHGDLEATVDELEDELEEERERLTKLYGVYEETEAERDDLAARLRRWEAWWDAHQETLEAVPDAVSEVPEAE